MNLVILTGRMTKSPEIKYTENKKAHLSFSLAVDDGKDKDGNKRTCFINCGAWGKTAEIIDQYFNKGDPITVVGKLSVRSYEKDGQKKTFTEVNVETFEFQMGKKEKEEAWEPITDNDEVLPF